MGLIWILLAVVLLFFPEDSFLLVVLVLSAGLLISGVSTLIYYFTMARFMVGGKMMLYKGVIIFDFGVLTASLADLPRTYVLLYLVAIHAFSGFVEILRVMEVRRYGGKNWRLKLGHGIINLVMCILCLVYIKNTNTVIVIYALGILYSGILTFITAFRKTALVYIQ